MRRYKDGPRTERAFLTMEKNQISTDNAKQIISSCVIHKTNQISLSDKRDIEKYSCPMLL